MQRKCTDFPLYDELLNSIPEKHLDLSQICSTINSLKEQEHSQEHYEIIMALIFHHDIKNNGTPLTMVPYDGKLLSGGKGVIFQISQLPIQLQQIIGNYLIKCSGK